MWKGNSASELGLSLSLLFFSFSCLFFLLFFSLRFSSLPLSLFACLLRFLLPVFLASILMTHTDIVTVTWLGQETGIVRGSDNEVV